MEKIHLQFVGNLLFHTFSSVRVCIACMFFLNYQDASVLGFLRDNFLWIKVVLNTFEAQPLSDEEGDANNLEEETVNFSIKYLTSSKLMGLEVSSLTKLTVKMLMS